MTVYNTKPKPRALLINFSDEEIKTSGISTIFPSYKCIASWQIDQVRIAEFDVVIILEADEALNFTIQPHLVFVGGNNFSQFWADEQDKPYKMLTYRNSVATEFVIEDDLPEGLNNLVRDSLLPLLQAKPQNPILVGEQDSRLLKSMWQPVIKDADDNVLVGYVQRHPSYPTEQWYLPPDVNGKGLGDWLRILMKRWAETDPETFSLTGDWRDDVKWQTAGERGVRSKILSTEQAFSIAVADHKKAITELDASFEAERAKADKDHRLLLTAQGTILKNKVADTLICFGFNITNTDDTAKKGDLLEDLRLTTTIDGASWVALAEVRGYKRGAQLSDLLRISGRFVKRYMQENKGSTPNAAWYIVNHDVSIDPGKRQQALSDNKKEVKTFAEDDNGLVVDTITLFQLRVAVDSGIISADEARQLLVNKSGFFELSNLGKSAK